MSKAKQNYIVDIIIGIAFVGSTISGLVFLIPLDMLSSEIGVLPTVLGLSFKFWSDLHTISSLTMVAGVGLHLVLHWKWIVSMTKQIVKQRGTKSK